MTSLDPISPRARHTPGADPDSSAETNPRPRSAHAWRNDSVAGFAPHRRLVAGRPRMCASALGTLRAMPSKARTGAQDLAQLPADRRGIIVALRRVVRRNLDRDVDQPMHDGKFCEATPTGSTPPVTTATRASRCRGRPCLTKALHLTRPDVRVRRSHEATLVRESVERLREEARHGRVLRPTPVSR